MVRRASSFDGSFATRIPGVRGLAAFFERIANARVGRVPIGLVALLPIAIVIDLFDVADELALGPVGIAVSFILESAFLLAITGRAGYALGFAGLDLLPIVDVMPWATITVVRQIVAALREGPVDGRAPGGATGPVIDV